jgi:antitoxin (DNA-binding transcriptional repressor) of toxin-antitoxin stability system
VEEGRVGNRELKDNSSSIIKQVEKNAAISVTKPEHPVARTVSTDLPPHLSALIADGAVRPAEGPRYMPLEPAKLCERGKTASVYVSEGRR